LEDEKPREAQWKALKPALEKLSLEERELATGYI